MMFGGKGLFHMIFERNNRVPIKSVVEGVKFRVDFFDEWIDSTVSYHSTIGASSGRSSHLDQTIESDGLDVL